MIIAIRIKGRVKIKEKIKNTLERLRLERKYSCVLLSEKKEILGMIEKVRDFVAYGKIDNETLSDLIEKRARKEGNKKLKKEEAKKVFEYVLKSQTLKNSGIKQFFRLHPPRGGIKSKEHFPRGVLGNHGEKINQLVKRML